MRLMGWHLISSVCYGRDEDNIEYAERLEEYNKAAKLLVLLSMFVLVEAN